MKRLGAIGNALCGRTFCDECIELARCALLLFGRKIFCATGTYSRGTERTKIDVSAAKASKTTYSIGPFVRNP